MDPDEALAQIRAAIQNYRENFASDVETEAAAASGAVDDIIEHFEALDEWLSQGGFRPTPWNRPATRPTVLPLAECTSRIRDAVPDVTAHELVHTAQWMRDTFTSQPGTTAIRHHVQEMRR